MGSLAQPGKYRGVERLLGCAIHCPPDILYIQVPEKAKLVEGMEPPIENMYFLSGVRTAQDPTFWLGDVAKVERTCVLLNGGVLVCLARKRGKVRGEMYEWKGG